MTNFPRVIRLMRSIISDLNIDLSGMRVLTEAASGNFSVTPVLAALAGADHVIAVGRSSRWGSFTEVAGQVLALAKAANCPDVIQLSDNPASHHGHGVNVVTNLGFVRPIDADLLTVLPKDAAIPLMWEPWEVRQGEVDISACRARGIPVLGTNENHPRLRIFGYLARIAERLLFERDIEVERSRLLLVASDPFGTPIEKGLCASGAEVSRLDPTANSDWNKLTLQHYANIDAVIVAEHCSQAAVIGPGGLSATNLAEAGAVCIHICGNVDETALFNAKLPKHPAYSVAQGKMAATTSYVGPRPVIDLHAAGLEVGAMLVRLLRAGEDDVTARAKVVASGLGADFTEQFSAEELEIKNAGSL